MLRRALNRLFGKNGVRQNRAIVLSRRPNGEVRTGDLTLKTSEAPNAKDGEILVESLWLSLDPYMRPQMNDMESYQDPVAIGGTMPGEVVGRVIDSKSGKFQVGDIVTCHSGWQEYYAASDSEDGLYKVDPKGIPVQAYLGVAGMPGRTAYCGLTFLGKPVAGETLVVSAASGAVGSVVGQLAKSQNCKVVGIAGGSKKCEFVVNDLGFDACLDYKSGDLSQQLKAACPNGIDIYFENVGGDVSKAIVPLLNKGSRVPICGFVSVYNTTSPETVETPMHIFGAMKSPPEHRFFLVAEWQDQHQEITNTLADLVRSGDLKYRESVSEGLESAPEAFKGMLAGKNFGKQLVHIRD